MTIICCIMRTRIAEMNFLCWTSLKNNRLEIILLVFYVLFFKLGVDACKIIDGAGHILIHGYFLLFAA